ncbi:MAG: hypothetical protein WB676_19580, partial [Bryobacteraceae bacterium]
MKRGHLCWWSGLTGLPCRHWWRHYSPPAAIAVPSRWPPAIVPRHVPSLSAAFARPSLEWALRGWWRWRRRHVSRNDDHRPIRPQSQTLASQIFLFAQGQVNNAAFAA